MAWARIARGVLRATAARPRTLLALWTALVLGCVPLAPGLLTHTSVSTEPPAGVASEAASARIHALFPKPTNASAPKHAVGEKNVAIIYVEAPEGGSVVPGSALETISSRAVARYANESGSLGPGDLSGRVESYWTLVRRGESDLAESLVSKNGRASFITIAFSRSKGAGKDLLGFLSEVRTDPAIPADFYVGVTGIPVVGEESIHTIMRDMGSTDVVVVPLALLCVGFMVKSWRLLGITLCNLASSTVLSFTATYLLCQHGYQVSTMAPALMSSVLLALSIDYSLFLLTRFAEETASGKSVEEAVELSLVFAGKTIAGSGSTLCMCFAALAFFPLQLISTMGVGVGLAILCAMLSNVLLTPILIFSAPRFFSASGWCAKGTVEREEAEQGQLGRSRCLYPFARAATSPWTLALVILFAAAAGWFLVPVCRSIVTEADMMNMVPRGSVASVTTDRMSQNFPVGFADPMTFLFEPTAGHVFEPAFWTSATAVLRNISSLMPTAEPATIISPMFVRGFALPYNASSFEEKRWSLEQAEIFRRCHESFDHTVPSWSQLENPSPCTPGLGCCKKLMHSTKMRLLIAQRDPSALFSNKPLDKMVTAVRQVLDQTVNKNGTAVIAKVMTNDAVGSRKALELVEKMRSVIRARDPAHEPLTASLAGLDAEMADLVAIIDQCTPPILAVTLLLVLAVMGVLYRSVVIPLRSIITIGLTCVIGFGVIVLIYQDGVMGARVAFLAPVGAINFLVPAMAFTMILGLSLDYDVFLLGRIVELRDAGYSDADAVVLGGVKTNKIITAAGTIMSIAFSGLLMSSVTLLNMCGVVLITSVLLDTFLMRTVVTPALMAGLGSANWFPRKVPVPTRRVRYENSVLSAEALAPVAAAGGAEALLAEASAV